MVIEIRWKNLFLDWFYECIDYKITKDNVVIVWEDGTQEYRMNEISEITVRMED